MAHGCKGKGMDVFITKTLPPLEQDSFPENLNINNADVVLYHNNIKIDTLENIGNGRYKTDQNFHFVIGDKYKLQIKYKDYPEIISENIKMPKAARILKLDYSFSSLDTLNIAKTYNYLANIEMLKHNENVCNSFDYEYFVDGKPSMEGAFFDYANTEYLNCNYCYNFLDNTCITTINDSIVQANLFIKIESERENLNEKIDSFIFKLHTFSKSAEIACKNDIDIEELLDFPIPLKASSAPTYTNFKNGYGVFILENVDSIIIKN